MKLMKNLMRKKAAVTSKEPGLVPGSLVHIGATYSEETTIDSFVYDADSFEFREALSSDSIDLPEENEILWLNTTGLHDPQVIGDVGERMRIHPLFLEDIMDTTHRPKAEYHEGQTLFLMKMIDLGEDGFPLYEQVSLIIGETFTATFQERIGDVFDPVRKRIMNKTGIIRTSGPDYLPYALIDSVVDRYFVVLESLYDKIEQIEQEIEEAPSSGSFGQISRIRKEMVFMRKAVWPLREATAALVRNENGLIDKDILPYYRDVYDHVIQIMDQIEAFRDIVSAVSDSYMSSLSNTMNSVMKVLTLISTIFIPLSFIAGVYGMNFVNMPELSLPWGYFAAIGFMITTAVAMVIIFKRKNWF